MHDSTAMNEVAPQINFSGYKPRINDFCDEYCDPGEDEERGIRSLIAQLNVLPDDEERLFMAFLVTHFDDYDTARDFYSQMNWRCLQDWGQDDLRKQCVTFFSPQKPPRIGDHRRYFNTRSRSQKVTYTYEILTAYKNCISDYGDQSSFFDISGQPAFETLYVRMAQIRHFGTRLPRFDHLERVSIAYEGYVVPTDTLYIKDSTGPLDGLTYLFFQIRYRHTNRREFKRYLTQTFPRQWNSEVDRNSAIEPGADFADIITVLERWLIEYARARVPADKQGRFFLFNLESYLCNMQKGR